MNDQSKLLDPVFRCDSCQRLVLLKTIHNSGCCPKCGNKRMREVSRLTQDEHMQLEAWGYSDFLAKFEGVSDE